MESMSNPQIDIVDRLLKTSDPSLRFEFDRAQCGRIGKMEPEEKLMLAILEDALNHLRGKPVAGLAGKPQRWAYEETIQWFQSDTEDYVFSFVTICERFGFEPRAVRAAVLGKREAA
jgi:hypothetical protein